MAAESAPTSTGPTIQLPVLDAYLPLSAAAIRAGCSIGTIRRAIRQGRLPARELASSGLYVVSAPDLDAFISTRNRLPRRGQFAPPAQAVQR